MKYKNIKIRKNKNGVSWFARFRKNNKQHFISDKTQLGCYNKLKKAYERETNKNEKTELTFIEWYEKWLNLYKTNIKETTLTDYNSSLNHTKDIKNMPINKITSIDILTMLNKINFERRKQKVYELLKDIFKKAVDNDLIVKNPLDKIDKPKHKKVKGNALTDNDEIKLENEFINKQADIFLITLYQGLRKGEALALEYKDFDLINKTLTINKSLNTDDKIDKTKNDYSDRIMPLFDKTIKIIKKYENSTGRIFNISQRKCQDLFKNIIDSIETEKKYTIHSLRHTFITKCQEKNIPLHIIQHWCGHVLGSNVTNNVYTHTRRNAELLYYNIINE